MATRISIENLYQSRSILLKAGENKKLITITPNVGVSTGVTNFLSLLDTPANYTGEGSKVLAVNVGETAVEFIDVNLLVPDISTLEGEVDAIDVRLTAAEAELVSLDADITTNADDIAALDVRLTSVESDGLAARMTAAEAAIVSNDGDITTLQTDLGTAQSDITGLESDVSDLTAMDTNAYTVIGVSKGNLNLGTFAGTTIGDNVTIKAAFQQLELALEAISIPSSGNPTVIGVSGDDLETFTGTVINDNVTIKVALQELETYVETTRGTQTSQGTAITDLTTLSGVAANETDLGTFTGDVISDDVTIKTALQELETLLITVRDTGSTAEDAALRTLTGTSLGDEDLGTFTGNLITDNLTIKAALQLIESAVELNSGDIYNLDVEASAMRTLSGTIEGDTHLGTFDGSILSDNGDIKQALGELEAAIEATDSLEVISLRTLTGTATSADDLGTFPGSTISDNVTIKTALTEVETALEGLGTSGTLPITIVTTTTVTITANGRFLFDAATAGGNLAATLPAGTTGMRFTIGFLGTADYNINLLYGGQNIAGFGEDFTLDKDNMVLVFEYVNSAVGWKIIDGVGEGAASGGDGPEATALRTLTGTSEGDEDLGTFTGTTITDDQTIKGALQELETAVEAGGGGGSVTLVEKGSWVDNIVLTEFDFESGVPTEISSVTDTGWTRTDGGLADDSGTSGKTFALFSGAAPAWSNKAFKIVIPPLNTETTIEVDAKFLHTDSNWAPTLTLILYTPNGEFIDQSNSMYGEENGATPPYVTMTVDVPPSKEETILVVEYYNSSEDPASADEGVYINRIEVPVLDSSATTYDIGDVVRHAGRKWECMVDGATDQPSQYSTQWVEKNTALDSRFKGSLGDDVEVEDDVFVTYIPDAGDMPAIFADAVTEGWTVVSRYVDALTGSVACLKSPATADFGTSSFIMPITATRAGNVSVKFTSSSEIADEMIIEWREVGAGSWTEAESAAGNYIAYLMTAEIPIPSAGDYEIRARYTKDVDTAVGEDAGYVLAVITPDYDTFIESVVSLDRIGAGDIVEQVNGDNSGYFMALRDVPDAAPNINANTNSRAQFNQMDSWMQVYPNVHPQSQPSYGESEDPNAVYVIVHGASSNSFTRFKNNARDGDRMTLIDKLGYVNIPIGQGIAAVDSSPSSSYVIEDPDMDVPRMRKTWQYEQSTNTWRIIERTFAPGCFRLTEEFGENGNLTGPDMTGWSTDTTDTGGGTIGIISAPKVIEGDTVELPDNVSSYCEMYIAPFTDSENTYSAMEIKKSYGDAECLETYGITMKQMMQSGAHSIACTFQSYEAITRDAEARSQAMNLEILLYDEDDVLITGWGSYEGETFVGTVPLNDWEDRYAFFQGIPRETRRIEFVIRCYPHKTLTHEWRAHLGIADLRVHFE